MKKFIVFLSSVALVGSVSYAMDEEAVEGEMIDEAMVMAAPAPSVTVSGSAAIGVINDSIAESSLQLINEYKVSFSSSSTTDGGLVFGAGIAIEDTHDKDPEKSVKNSNVYVGGADGSWKVQFGGNDPGIDLVGAIGIAGDHLDMDAGDATVSLSGSFGGANYRLTVGDPASSNSPVMPTHPMDMIDTSGMSVTPPVEEVKGMDAVERLTRPWKKADAENESLTVIDSGKITLPIYAGPATQQLATPVANRDWFNEDGVLTVDPTSVDIDGAGPLTTNVSIAVNTPSGIEAVEWDVSNECGVGRLDYYEVDADGLDFTDGQLVSAEVYDKIPDGPDKTTVFTASPTKVTNYYRIIDGNLCRDGNDESDLVLVQEAVPAVLAVEGMPAMVVGAPVHTVSSQEDIADVYIGKNDDQWSVGFSYTLDTIKIGVGMDYGKGLALSLGSNVSGIDVSAYYSKSEFEDIAVGFMKKGGPATYEPRQDADGKWYAHRTGGGYTWDLVEGTQENTGLGVKASMAAGEGATVSVAYSTLKKEIEAAGDEFDSSTDKKKMELDMSYALGGGATLHAGLDKIDEDGKDSQTKLEAKIAMSF